MIQVRHAGHPGHVDRNGVIDRAWNSQVREQQVIIACRTTLAASDAQVASEVTDVLRRRAAAEKPPITLAISDAVALGIADRFRSATPAGQVMERFRRGSPVESDELVEAAKFEQGFATAEGYAALYCLVTWVRAKEQRQRDRLSV
ncbi:MAG: hypothetical protein ACXVX8_18225 [Blastococcus sp.]